MIIKPYDGEPIKIKAGEEIEVPRGRSFAFDIRKKSGKLLRRDKTKKHFIILFGRGYGAEYTNNEEKWREWAKIRPWSAKWQRAAAEEEPE